MKNMERQKLMKVEINNENKVRFFALYWGQEVLRFYSTHETILQADVNPNAFLLRNEVNGWLSLKPLSQISDEDIKMLCEIFLGKECTPKVDKSEDGGFIIIEYSNQPSENPNYDSVSMCLYISDDTITNHWNYIYSHGTGDSAEHLRDSLLLYEYLRSKGYALPWMGLSVEEMVEAGWIKLI